MLLLPRHHLFIYLQMTWKKRHPLNLKTPPLDMLLSIMSRAQRWRTADVVPSHQRMPSWKKKRAQLGRSSRKRSPTEICLTVELSLLLFMTSFSGVRVHLYNSIGWPEFLQIIYLCIVWAQPLDKVEHAKYSISLHYVIEMMWYVTHSVNINQTFARFLWGLYTKQTTAAKKVRGLKASVLLSVNIKYYRVNRKKHVAGLFWQEFCFFNVCLQDD